jgi:hypothetical protein
MTSDSDSDGCADLVEIASIDTNRSITTSDNLAVSRRALRVPPFDTPGYVPDQDYVLDLDKNGVVGEPDKWFASRAVNLPDWLPTSC